MVAARPFSLSAADRMSHLSISAREDDAERWLEAGEALSTLWLTATALNVSLLPLSDVVSVPATREALRRTLRTFDHPYLALRLGIADPQSGTPPRTPRLPAVQLIDVVPWTA